MAAGLYDITNEVLGKGHYAVVKLARHCLTGEAVAIKIIDKVKLAKDVLGQLRHEIRLWSILSEHEHPNVVKLYQCIDTRSKLYLVMEYCGRKVCDLFDHIQHRNGGNGLPETEARHIFRQVCSAIHYCHSLRIVHRDLKPENILIIADSNAGFDAPRVKICDFGFSNQWARDSILLQTSCGSLAYSAPEILLGNLYNAPMIDIWALGCILYILLYGINPFIQGTDNETLIKILDCSFETPSRDSLSNEVILLIRSLLRKVPEDRLTIEQVVNSHWLTSGDSSSKDNAALRNTMSHSNRSNIDFTVNNDTINEPSLTGSETRRNICDNNISATANNNDNNNCILNSKADKGNALKEIGNAKEYGKTKEIVNDQIIDAMILRGINLSKDVIRRMLMDDSKTEHDTTYHEDKHVTLSNNHSNTTGSCAKSPEVNHLHYVRATYQLLKDKNARDTALPGASSAADSENCSEKTQTLEEHERSSRMMFNAKRGKLSARKTLLGNGGSSAAVSLGVRQPICSRLPELAPLPEPTSCSGGLFALPLGRKCSVVSEEGLATENNTPEPPLCSPGQSEERLMTPEVLPENDSNIKGLLRSTPSLLITDASEHTSTAILEKPRFNLLHPVSSSPDFLVATNFEEDHENGNDKSEMVITEADQSDCISTGRPRVSSDVSESSVRKDNHDTVIPTSGESIFSRFQRKQPLGLTNVRVSKNRIVEEQSNTSKTPTPSVRVIIQSKSLNNIALTDPASRRQSQTENGVSGSGASKPASSAPGADVKLVNSMSAASIGKMVKSDKADCCNVS